jgi:hypothetical protein
VNLHRKYRTSVVCTGYCPKSLLPGGVPYLQLAAQRFHFEHFEPEVHSDRGQVVLYKIVVAEPQEERGFADALVADDDNFEQIVLFLYHIILLPNLYLLKYL